MHRPFSENKLAADLKRTLRRIEFVPFLTTRAQTLTIVSCSLLSKAVGLGILFHLFKYLRLSPPLQFPVFFYFYSPL